MGRVSVGTTNVGLQSTLGVLVPGLSGNTFYSLADNVNSKTYPLQTGNNRRIGLYAQASGQFIFQIQIRSNNASFGGVSISYPFSQTSFSTEYLSISSQVYNFTFPYIRINATRIYPRVFQRWQIDQTGGTYATNSIIDVYPTDSIIINNYTLTAIFA